MNLYGLIVGIAIIIALNHFEKHQNILTISQIKFFSIGVVLSGILGARIYHVVDNWDYYQQYPHLIIQTWNGGLGIFGALLFSLAFIGFFCIYHKINPIKLIDFITPILPLSQAIGRVGNFVNHENPMWWFESLFCSILFLIVKKHPSNPTAKYFIGYGTIRLISEFFRPETWRIGQINIAQIISMVLIISGAILTYQSNKKSDKVV